MRGHKIAIFSCVFLGAITIASASRAGEFARELAASFVGGLGEGLMEGAVDAALNSPAQNPEWVAPPPPARAIDFNYQAWLQTRLPHGSTLYNRPCTVSDGEHVMGVPCAAVAAVLSPPVIDPQPVLPDNAAYDDGELYYLGGHRYFRHQRYRANSYGGRYFHGGQHYHVSGSHGFGGGRHVSLHAGLGRHR
jgi:hypothetical protein